MSNDDVELPLFPLRTILFPGGVLPLRIFEPRYIDMVGQCMKQSSGFGVCGVTEGDDTDHAAEIYSFGTKVEIIDFESLPENLLGITVKGLNKFNIIDSFVRPNGLRMASIRYVKEEVRAKIPKQYCRLAALLKRMLPDVEQYYGKAHMQSMEHDFEDAAWVAARLAEYLPFELSVKQTLLECDDPVKRLHILYETLKNDP